MKENYIILKDYNIIAINYNLILENIIITEFLLFLKEKNICQAKIDKEFKNILLHFIIKNIIGVIGNFSCVLFYTDNFDRQAENLDFNKNKFSELLKSSVLKIGSKFKIPVMSVQEDFKLTTDEIYRFKQLLENKKPVNLRVIKKFLSENNLVFMEKLVGSDRVLQKNLTK